MLITSNSYVINPVFFDKVPYDPYKDFEPVTLAVTSTTVLSVNPSVPAKTVKELADLIRANPGKFSFGSAGVGTGAHLTGELFRTSLKLDLVHVPYGGGGPAIAAILRYVASRTRPAVPSHGVSARAPAAAVISSTGPARDHPIRFIAVRRSSMNCTASAWAWLP